MAKTVKKEIVLEQERGIDVKKSIAKIIKDKDLSDAEKLAEIESTLQVKPTGISVVGTLLRPEKLMDTKTMSLKEKLGAIVIAGEVVNNLKNAYDSLIKQLEETPEEEVIDQLISEGALKPGETPVISVIDKNGVKHSGTLGTSTTSKLNMDEFKKFVEDPEVFKALPDLYKESKLRGNAFFKKLFQEDALGVYKKYFELNTETTTKIKGIKAAKVTED